MPNLLECMAQYKAAKAEQTPAAFIAEAHSFAGKMRDGTAEEQQQAFLMMAMAYPHPPAAAPGERFVSRFNELLVSLAASSPSYLQEALKMLQEGRMFDFPSAIPLLQIAGPHFIAIESADRARYGLTVRVYGEFLKACDRPETMLAQQEGFACFVDHMIYFHDLPSYRLDVAAGARRLYAKMLRGEADTALLDIIRPLMKTVERSPPASRVSSRPGRSWFLRKRPPSGDPRN
jgi:hypothetical protein